MAAIFETHDISRVALHAGQDTFHGFHIANPSKKEMGFLHSGHCGSIRLKRITLKLTGRATLMNDNETASPAPVERRVMQQTGGQMKIADKILTDDGFDSYDGKIDAIVDLARELEDISIDALKMFRCTQNPDDYPRTHWSNRLNILLHNVQIEGRALARPSRMQC